MSSTTKRLLAASAIFVVLLVLVIVVVQREGGETETPEDESTESQLPELEEGQVVELEVRRPDEPKVVLTRDGDGWRLTEPLEADANDNYVQLALKKLSSLQDSATGIAATRADNHEKLEVAESNGVRVIARGEKGPLVDLLVGAYKGGSTMVRVAGEEPVHGVQGAIKSSFNRNVDDWREKRVVDETAAHVSEARFENDHGSFHFVRGEDDEWKPTEGPEELEELSSSQIQSVVKTLSRMRAAGFAEPGVTKEEAGVGEGASTATLVLQEGGGEDGGPPASEQQIVLRLGNALEDEEQFYLLREDRTPIYVVSKFLADRIAPDAEQFQQSEEQGQAPGQGHPGVKGKLPEGMSKEALDQLLKQMQKRPVKMGGGNVGVKRQP